MSAVLESTQTKLVTADELFTMPDTERGCELVRGKIIKYMPAGNLHGIIALKIGRIVGNFVEDNDLGVVIAAETGFLISRNPDTVRAPDAAFISNEKLAEYGITEKFFPDAPDLAIEVVSPNDKKREIEDKVQDYLAAKVKLVWIIYPQKQIVAVHRQSKVVSILFETDELEGEEILPNFKFPLEKLFKNLPNTKQN